MKLVSLSMTPLGLALMLCACASGPNYKAPGNRQLGVPDQYLPGPFETRATGNQEQLAEWWDQFSDPTLSELVRAALKDNPDLQQALERARQARETRHQSRAALLPTLSAGNSSTFSDGKPAEGWSYSVGLDATWTLDLAGGARRGVEAASASYEAAGFNLANARALVAAETAQAYFDVLSTRQRILIAQSSVEAQETNLQIAQWRYEAGLGSGLDVAQAGAQRAQTAASLPLLRKLEAQSRYRLALLDGSAPGSVDAPLADRIELPRVPDTIALGIPADLLRRRPDLGAAERELAAATAQIGVSSARLFPALTLSGALDSSASTVSAIGEVLTGRVIANVSQLLFDGGRQRSAKRSQVAAAGGALARYRAAVLGALKDVESARVELSSSAERVQVLREQVAASETAALLARNNYRAGIVDLRALLDAERTLLTARDTLAGAQADRLAGCARLFVALGGGWDSRNLLEILEKS